MIVFASSMTPHRRKTYPCFGVVHNGKCSVYGVDSENMVILFLTCSIVPSVRTCSDWCLHHHRPIYPFVGVFRDCTLLQLVMQPLCKTIGHVWLQFCIIHFDASVCCEPDTCLVLDPWTLWCDKRSVNDPHNIREDLNCSLSFWSMLY